MWNKRNRSRQINPIVAEKDVILNTIKKYLSREMTHRIVATMSTHSINIWDRHYRTIQVVGHNLQGDIKIRVTFQPEVPTLSLRTYWSNMFELDEAETAWATSD